MEQKKKCFITPLFLTQKYRYYICNKTVIINQNYYKGTKIMLRTIQPNPQPTFCLNTGCNHKGSPKNYVNKNMKYNSTLLGILEALKYGEYETKYSHLTRDELLGECDTVDINVYHQTIVWDDPIAATQEVITRAFRRGSSEADIARHVIGFIKIFIAQNPAHKKWFTECELNNIVYVEDVVQTVYMQKTFVLTGAV